MQVALVYVLRWILKQPQMPATRPFNAESTTDTDYNTPTVSSTPFSLKYDKLIIAVGAYAQSGSQTVPHVWFFDSQNSLQCTWCKRTCALSERRKGCQENTQQDPRM